MVAARPQPAGAGRCRRLDRLAGRPWSRSAEPAVPGGTCPASSARSPNRSGPSRSATTSASRWRRSTIRASWPRCPITSIPTGGLVDGLARPAPTRIGGPDLAVPQARAGRGRHSAVHENQGQIHTRPVQRNAISVSSCRSDSPADLSSPADTLRMTPRAAGDRVSGARHGRCRSQFGRFVSDESAAASRTEAVLPLEVAARTEACALARSRHGVEAVLPLEAATRIVAVLPREASHAHRGVLAPKPPRGPRPR